MADRPEGSGPDLGFSFTFRSVRSRTTTDGSVIQPTVNQGLV